MSVTPDEVKARIEAGIPGAVASVTGDGHHFNAVVSAPAFSGLPRLAQHRLVYDVFGAELGDRIHALSIQTQTRTSETEKGL
jgi:acid stress-induced BolA-like protein IbaG/YrbA